MENPDSTLLSQSVCGRDAILVICSDIYGIPARIALADIARYGVVAIIVKG